MSALVSEVIEHPLDAETLSARWREILEDPRFANFVGKLDLDRWGRIVVSPVNTEHGGVAGELSHLLRSQLGGRTLVEVGVRTKEGVFAPDVAWCSESYWNERREQSPLEVAPELCVEIASPTNTLRDLRMKARSYIEAGAVESWILFPRSKRIEYHGKAGLSQTSSFAVDLSTLFN
jgi:Uma2 family endonuclease